LLTAAVRTTRDEKFSMSEQDDDDDDSWMSEQDDDDDDDELAAQSCWKITHREKKTTCV